jgi:hypothetical protein
LDALLQQLPIAVQLLLGLVEVAAVGRERGLLVGDDCVAGGASEAADVCWGRSICERGDTCGESDLGVHHRVQCTRSDGCLPTAPLRNR